MDRRRAAGLLASVARLGLVHSVCGQLYEEIVDVPARIARDPLDHLLAPGSPARYFLPVAPLARAALLAAVVTGWPEKRRRPALAAAAGATLAETAVTIHLLREVNPRLVVTGRRAPATARPELLVRWHRLNRARMLAASTAWCSLAAAGRDEPRRR